MSDINTYGALPGINTQVTSSEATVFVGRENRVEYGTIVLDSTAVDAGNTPTTTLRPGLVLGRITSSGNYKAYSVTATDGSEVARAVLDQGVTTLDNTGTAVAKEGHVVLNAILNSGNLIGLDYTARQQLLASGRYGFSDDIGSGPVSLGRWEREIPKTANYTVVAADNGKLFTTTGATGEVDFTLPAIATSAGLAFEFLNTVDQIMKVISAEGTNIIWDGVTQFTSLAFSTASHKCGGHLQFTANKAGTAWYVRQMGASTCTVTTA